MRLRPGKAAPTVEFKAVESSVGLTILPGYPLPEWAESAAPESDFAQAAMLSPLAGLGSLVPDATSAQLPGARESQESLAEVGVGESAFALSGVGIRDTTATSPLGPGPAVGATSEPSLAMATQPSTPDLSSDQIAMLSWLAERMAAGEFTAPGQSPALSDSGGGSVVQDPPMPSGEPAAAAPRKHRKIGRPGKKMVIFGTSALAVLGVAGVFGPRVLDSFSDAPEPVPATNLTMPAAIDKLVAVSTPNVSEQLQSMLGMGLRPAGITTTAGYGAKPEGPVTFAALASTSKTSADSKTQIDQWAQRMSAEVAAPIEGGSGASGVTCAAVTELPQGQPGSFCVFSGGDKRGMTYAVDLSPENAQSLTAQLRTGLIATP